MIFNAVDEADTGGNGQYPAEIFQKVPRFANAKTFFAEDSAECDTTHLDPLVYMKESLVIH